MATGVSDGTRVLVRPPGGACEQAEDRRKVMLDEEKNSASFSVDCELPGFYVRRYICEDTRILTEEHQRLFRYWGEQLDMEEHEQEAKAGRERLTKIRWGLAGLSTVELRGPVIPKAVNLLPPIQAQALVRKDLGELGDPPRTPTGDGNRTSSEKEDGGEGTSAASRRRKGVKSGICGRWVEYDLVCRVPSGKCINCKKKCSLTPAHMSQRKPAGMSAHLRQTTKKCRRSEVDNVADKSNKRPRRSSRSEDEGRDGEETERKRKEEKKKEKEQRKLERKKKWAATPAPVAGPLRCSCSHSDGWPAGLETVCKPSGGGAEREEGGGEQAESGGQSGNGGNVLANPSQASGDRWRSAARSGLHAPPPPLSPKPEPGDVPMPPAVSTGPRSAWQCTDVEIPAGTSTQITRFRVLCGS
ncbi:hypothetical protein C8R46DRAFT_1032043 [Mycena filopes]|nr:hypothetical protein C8R46DRAFT_1032043 [Mycena filopes]